MYKTQLKTSQLGATGLEITRVGFGAWRSAAGSAAGGPQDRFVREVIDTSLGGIAPPVPAAATAPTG